MRAEIESRPALIAAIGLVAGVAGRQVWEALAVFALVLFLLRSPRAMAIAGLPFLLGLSIGRPSLFSPALERQPFYGRLEITSVPRLQGSSYLALSRNELGDFILVAPANIELEVGSVVLVRGTLKPLRERAESGRSQLLGRVVANDHGVEVIGQERSAAWLGGVVQRRFTEFSDRSLGRERSAILQALSFNVVHGLDEEFRRNLQRTGTIHIVSASGAHVMILAGALALLFRGIPIMRHWQLLAMLAILCLYAAAAGFEPPIIRAIVMSALGFGAYLFAKEPDMLSAVSIALIGQVLWNPASIYDIGVQLSFVTVTAFGMFLTGLAGSRGPIGWIGLALKASFIASLATAPLTAYYFGQVSITSVLANLLIAGLVTPILIVSLGCFVASALLPAAIVGALMSATVAPWLEALRAIVDRIGSWEFSAVPVPGFSAYWLLVWYGLAIVLWRPRARMA